jgi:hypothetical protein
LEKAVLEFCRENKLLEEYANFFENRTCLLAELSVRDIGVFGACSSSRVF